MIIVQDKLEGVMKTRLFVLFVAVVIAVLIGLLFYVNAGAAYGCSRYQITEEQPTRILLRASTKESPTSIYAGLYVLRFYCNMDSDPEMELVARKRLWLKVEYWEAESLVRIIGAASPEVSWYEQFHWQRLVQDLRNTGWDVIITKFSESKLWCDLRNCADDRYFMACKVYGSIPGYFDCWYFKNP